MIADQGFDRLGADPCALIAVDIDGTLVADGGQPSTRVIAGLHALVESGVTVVLATGRQLHGVAPMVASVGLAHTWVVASDGAVVARFTGAAPTVHAVHMFDPRPLARAFLTRDAGVTLGCEDLGNGYLVNRRFEELIDPGDQQRVVSEFPAAVTMLTASSTRVSGDDLAQTARAAGLSCTGWDEHGAGWVDVAAAGLSKATGAASVARACGNRTGTTVAVGDFFNDMALLRWADLGIAMGHAPPAVKEEADLVTGPIGDDGLADVLEAMLPQPADRT